MASLLDEEELSERMEEAAADENYEYAKMYKDEIRRREEEGGKCQMIDQQSGISLESLFTWNTRIVTVLAVAYALSYDRKRIDWKLIGGGLIMQVIFALAVLYIPFVGNSFGMDGEGVH